MYQPIQLQTKSPSLRNSINRSLVAVITLLFAAMASVQSVHAATITVTNTNDSGAGSLRQAISDAAAGDTIDFQSGLTGTIILTTGELLISKNLTISGPGANTLAVSGDNASRVFHIGFGQTVTISGLTITDGIASGDFGGGIFSEQATLTVSDCTVSGNSAGAGAGIYNLGNATLSVINSTLSGNSASDGGGGIYNAGSGSPAALTVTNSTLSGNSASDGGGIFNDGQEIGSATLSVINSTLSGNSASLGGGGGIFNDGEDLGNATLMIGDTILNAGASGANIFNDLGTVTSLGYNLSSDNGGGVLTGTGDQINTDPMLGPLQDNGGPTFTHELLTGSPAIDMGDPSFTPPPDFDQRGPGFPRVVNGRIDIGSFEVQGPPVCVQGQGYWKNHPSAWPVTTLQLGNVTYTQDQLLSILHQPVRGNGLVLLAHQLIAAELNIANGADSSCIQQTIDQANMLIGDLVVPPVGTGYLAPRDVSALADTLDQYNEGMLCAPACEETPPPTPTAAPRSRPLPAARPSR
jgi:Chlamydia polymorphic membrane protein (Chlamydia_PMP) repeat